MSRFKFPVLADKFERRLPEWLDDNYYGVDSVMTAILARLENNGREPDEHIDEMNNVYDQISCMEVAQSLRLAIAGHTVFIWRRDCSTTAARTLELVMYKW